MNMALEDLELNWVQGLGCGGFYTQATGFCFTPMGHRSRWRGLHDLDGWISAATWDNLTSAHNKG